MIERELNSQAYHRKVRLFFSMKSDRIFVFTDFRVEYCPIF
ncbi:hypothetical protein HMPREF1118_0062 [Haemophilus parainfluenzae HK262]|nr:hypothetical protein HMPREF1118_0062 [Haemophilus parainfluenzae HK262]